MNLLSFLLGQNVERILYLMSNQIEIIMNLDTLEIFEVIDHSQDDLEDIEVEEENVSISNIHVSECIQLTLFDSITDSMFVSSKPYLYNSS